MKKKLSQIFLIVFAFVTLFVVTGCSGFSDEYVPGTSDPTYTITFKWENADGVACEKQVLIKESEAIRLTQIPNIPSLLGYVRYFGIEGDIEEEAIDITKIRTNTILVVYQKVQEATVIFNSNGGFGITKQVNAAGATSVPFDTTATDAEKVAHDKAAINLPTDVIASFPVTTQSIYGSTLTWESSDDTILNDSYIQESGWVEVIRNANEDKSASLTVTIENGAASDTKTFTIAVPKGTTTSRLATVTYSVSEAGVTTPEVTSFNVGKAVTLPTLTKADYIFQGWYDNASYNGRKYTTTLGLINDATLYAKFEAVTLTGIAITKQPNKTTYTALEAFDATGLEVTGSYNNGSNAIIANSSLTFDKTTLHGNDTTVVVSYGGFNANVSVTVNKIEMAGVSLATGTTTYDGTAKSLEVTGTVPSWLTVSYNNATDAGEHNITATFAFANNATAENYVLPTALEATLTITKIDPIVNPVYTPGAPYYVNNAAPAISLTAGDTAGSIVWDQTYTIAAGDNTFAWTFTPTDTTNYNGKTGTAKFTGTSVAVASLEVVTNPDKMSYLAFETLVKTGLVVKAINNDGSQTTLGADDIAVVYNSGANFKAGDTSVTISYGGASVVINGFTVAKITMTGVTYENITVDYDGSGKNIAVTGTVPTWLTVSYDADKVNADTYTMHATFAFANGATEANYVLPAALEATLTINKISYNMSGVTFTNASHVYDGNEKTLVVAGNLPQGVTVAYTTNKLTNVGSVTATASFTGDTNHNAIADMTATLTITKATYNMSGVTFTNVSHVYDGSEKSLVIAGNLPQGVSVSYENNTLTNVGSTNAIAKFTGDANNYNTIANMTATLTITAKAASLLTIETIADQIVAGRTFAAVQPTIVVKDGETTLVITNDYSVEYSNNTAIATGTQVTATVTITGAGNYDGTKEATFIIKLSDQFKAEEDAAELEKVKNVDTATTNTLPVVLPNGSTVSYGGNPTGITINADGTFTIVKLATVQTVTATATITNGNEVAYVIITFTIHASQTFTDPTTNVEVTEVPENVANVEVTEVSSETYGAYVIENNGTAEAAYDITMKNSENTEVQPNGSVKVTLPIPAGVQFANLAIYHRNDAGVMEQVTGLINNGTTVSFYASSFSIYVIVDTTTFSVTYDANGGNGTVPTTTSYKKNAEVTVAENPFTFAGKEFAGWATTAQGEVAYIEAATFNINSDVTLYAVWNAVQNTNITTTINLENSGVKGKSNYDTGAERAVTIDNVGFGSVYSMANSTNIQGQKNTFKLYNTTSLGKIQTITITLSEAKTFKLYAGTSYKPTTNPITASVSEAIYTFDFSELNYSYFCITENTAAIYITSIVIVYSNSGVTPATKLTAPTISLNNNVVSWTAVPNASGYDVYNGNTKLTTTPITTTSYTLTMTDPDTYPITVKAVGDGSTYLTSASSNSVNYVIEMTDTQKVAADKAALPNLASTIISNFTLTTEGTNGSTITWDSSNSDVIAIVGGTATVTRPASTGDDAIVTLTATIKSGLIEDTKEYTITVTKEGAAVVITELFISEYCEGSSNNKYIEIYNGTASAIDLSGYSVKLYANGAKTATNTHTFPEGTMIASNGTYVLYNSSANDTIKAVIPSASSSAANFNGDDAIGLYKGDTLIDVIGDIGTDPGTAWTDGTGGSTADKTLVRSAVTFSGSTTFTWSEWVVYAKDTFTYIGSHTVSSSN